MHLYWVLHLLLLCGFSVMCYFCCLSLFLVATADSRQALHDSMSALKQHLADQSLVQQFQVGTFVSEMTYYVSSGTLNSTNSTQVGTCTCKKKKKVGTRHVTRVCSPCFVPIIFNQFWPSTKSRVTGDVKKLHLMALVYQHNSQNAGTVSYEDKSAIKLLYDKNGEVQRKFARNFLKRNSQ